MFSGEVLKKKAIAYYRHSAEDKQENSVPIQREHAEKFAAQYGIEIIHEEADEDKTGLLATRPGFERLFSDWILDETVRPFDYVLVYDVSRWGRFQDPDEAAYYEFRCKQRGKKVIYITRGFPKEEQGLMNPLQTSIERYMAAEYSRQLSDKVFHGCVKVSQQGFSAGGTAPYGMGRLLLDANKKPKGILKPGEHKAIDNERVTFTPLNDQTTVAVQSMFKLIVDSWLTPAEAATEINKKRIPSANGGQWNTGKVLRVLTNETYTGTRIYNKTWNRLKQGHRANPKTEWVFAYNAFEGIVDQETFTKAQEHLYWQMKPRHRRGIYATRKAKVMLQKELNLFLEKEGVDGDAQSNFIKDFPVVFAVTFYINSTPRWCFLIPPHLRQAPFVLGVGVSLDKHNPIDGYFLIPTETLLGDTVEVFGEDDDKYTSLKITEENAGKHLLALAAV